ncbi:hypothetical protein FOL47_006708 [Perkinsus chesapeaki]|uniref:Tubulin-specific chaperone A n=1 Tax=Perkinsus chesapeaki TaxID=330153 RepID=A0A7J6MY18_PERCH|nr:hypothetical protein FOL47_006708 [Perkinsus chesapeaki]
MTVEQKRPCGPPKDPKVKKLYVAANALRRIIKDAKYYREEEDRLRAKRRERLEKGGDADLLAADLKQMDEVIKETQAMSPVVHDQFVAAYKVLFTMLSDGTYPDAPAEGDNSDEPTEEQKQILLARLELENAEKEDLLRDVQGEIKAARDRRTVEVDDDEEY